MMINDVSKILFFFFTVPWNPWDLSKTKSKCKLQMNPIPGKWKFTKILREMAKRETSLGGEVYLVVARFKT